MCFSAEASFVASAGLAVAGTATLRHAEKPSDWMVAAIPLGFGLHQFVEGVVWSTTPGGDAHLYAARLFAFLAFVMWPIYIPVAFLWYENDAVLKKRLSGLVALGVFAGLYFLYFMIDDPVKPRIQRGSLQYRFDYPLVYLSHIAYGIPVMLSPALSRDKIFRVFGAGLFVAYLIAYYAWFKSHPSVWCFFAAVLTGLIYLHFRLRDGLAAGPATA